MTTFRVIVLLSFIVAVFSGMTKENGDSPYFNLYNMGLSEFRLGQQALISSIENQADISGNNIAVIKKQVEELRIKLKAIDFWLRYLQPVAYKRINGPLPVEWETEVFEKFEKPYKRYGSGLTLAELYLDELEPAKDSLVSLLRGSDESVNIFQADSTTRPLARPDHFYFANRLFLLNLSAIYTTGFECPDPGNVIPELETMLESVKQICLAYNKSFPATALPENYLRLYESMEHFVASQRKDPAKFDHFHFIKDYVNPLFSINQHLISSYRVMSGNYNDYSLSNDNRSIFNKDLYNGQNSKGIFIAVDDKEKLQEIKAIGKMLFFDPILSGNGKRSCASCHKPDEYFNDTTETTALAFNRTARLSRNTPPW